MKRRIIALLEGIFLWTVGPVLLFLSPQARTARRWTLGVGGGIVAAWWTGFMLWALGAVVALIPGSWLGTAALDPHERYVLERALSDTVDEDHPVYQHTLRMERRAPRYAALEEVHPAALQAAVLLHDAMLEHPRIPAEQRFCTHGLTGSIIGVRTARQLPDRSNAFAVVVGDAVLRHVGPVGFNWEWQEKRLASLRCETRLPTPVSRLGKLLADLDHMDSLTVASAVEQATAKRGDAQFKRATLEEILRRGRDSVLKEAADRAQVLQTRSGRACGKQLARHVSAFLRGVDARAVKDIPALREAAQRYLGDNPEPSCLEAPTAALLDANEPDEAPTGAGPVN